MLALFAVLGACAHTSVELASAPALSSLINAAPPVPTQLAFAEGPAGVIEREHARWVRADWADLPGWDLDATAQLWPALLRSCERATLEWVKICLDAKALPALERADHARVRQWLQERLDAWRVESPEGSAQGLITGYFEPTLQASRVPTKTQQVPLYAVPLQLSQYNAQNPYWSRQQLETLPQAKASLAGKELAYVASALDALTLQIQGSGRLEIENLPDGVLAVRMAFAGHNHQPYKSVGRWLIEHGELSAEKASWPAIKAWAEKNPQRLTQLLWSNPRVVFFREEPLLDPSLGPNGAQGVPLTPGRSIAVDARSVPYGAPVWLDTTEPLSNQKLRRLVMAQDTGSAITGAVRADYFWGWGPVAEQQAGRMKQPLRLWVLWPK
jgi:membrane-bound lytic murein transglycosylase A